MDSAARHCLYVSFVMQNGIIEKTVKIPFLALKINQLFKISSKLHMPDAARRCLSST
jgi:hypothetical protein